MERARIGLQGRIERQYAKSQRNTCSDGTASYASSIYIFTYDYEQSSRIMRTFPKKYHTVARDTKLGHIVLYKSAAHALAGRILDIPSRSAVLFSSAISRSSLDVFFDVISAAASLLSSAARVARTP